MRIGSLGPLEIALILVVVLIVFGVGRLPDIGGALGKTIREFRRELGGPEEERQLSPKTDDREDGEPSERPRTEH